MTAGAVSAERAVPRAWRWYAYMAGQAISNLGDQIAQLALGLLVVDLTGSALLTGLMGTFWALPNLGLSLVAGTFADRVDRRRLMLAMDGVRLVLVALVPILAALGQLAVWHLFVLAFALSSLDTFFDTAALAMLPELVEKRRLGTANGHLYTMQAGTGIVGPALAGALVTAIGTAESLWVDSASYLFSAASLLLIGFGTRLGRAALDTARASATFWQDLVEGLRYTLAQPVLRAIGGMMFIVNIGNTAAYAILLFHARAVLGLSAEVIGIAFSAGTVGFLLGSLVASRLGARFGRARTAMSGNAVGALGLVCWALSTDATLIAIGGVLRGINGPLVNVNTFTIRHETVPPHLLGRVFAVARFLAWSANPLAAALGGIAAERLGTPPVFLAAAVVVLLGATFGWFAGLRKA